VRELTEDQKLTILKVSLEQVKNSLIYMANCFWLMRVADWGGASLRLQIAGRNVVVSYEDYTLKGTICEPADPQRGEESKTMRFSYYTCSSQWKWYEIKEQR